MNEKKDIERLFRQHYEKMYHLARCILFDADECKDVVSEVFTDILANGTVLLPGSEERYLMQSVRHRCMNVIAHKSVKDRVVQLLMADEVGLSDDDNSLLDQLYRVIDHLEPPIRRVILRLRYLQGLTYQQIAEEESVSKVTVYNHLSEAMDTIRKHFNQARQ